MEHFQAYPRTAIHMYCSPPWLTFIIHFISEYVDLTVPILLDFGKPGLRVQEGYQKVGLAEGKAKDGVGIFESSFDCYTTNCTITIEGYTHIKNNYPPITSGAYKQLSNLSASTFLKFDKGVMKVEVKGFKPWSLMQVKTYHHSTLEKSNFLGGDLSIQYAGECTFLWIL